MHFILALGKLAKFDNLRTLYETEKKVDLATKPSIIGMPVFFGGTDVINRNKQVTFLEKINATVKEHVVNEDEIKTLQQQQVYIIAARFMIAACLYVHAQINSSKRNSALYRIIEDNLGITPENFLDDEDKEACYLAAERLINIPNAFEHSNALLQKKGIKAFTEKEWQQFSAFLKEMCPKKEAHNQQTHFPIMSITQSLFGTTFSYVGATVGLVLAEGVSKSSSAISPRLQLTALVGSTLFVFSPSGATGVTLFAPVIATKLLTSFCTVSLAHAMGTAAGYLGQGVGLGVGLPLDLACNLLRSVCSIIARYSNKASEFALIDGIRIVDGVTIIAGIPIQLVPENALRPGCIKKTLEITEEGELLIEGEKVNDTRMQIPPEVLEELNRQLTAWTPKPEHSEVKQSGSKVTEPIM